MDDLFPADWLAACIERDVMDIASDKFFNIPEKVKAEVERRLAGIEHTRRVAEKVG